MPPFSSRSLQELFESRLLGSELRAFRLYVLRRLFDLLRRRSGGWRELRLVLWRRSHGQREQRAEFLPRRHPRERGARRFGSHVSGSVLVREPVARAPAGFSSNLARLNGVPLEHLLQVLPGDLLPALPRQGFRQKLALSS